MAIRTPSTTALSEPRISATSKHGRAGVLCLADLLVRRGLLDVLLGHAIRNLIVRSGLGTRGSRGGGGRHRRGGAGSRRGGDRVEGRDDREGVRLRLRAAVRAAD